MKRDKLADAILLLSYIFIAISVGVVVSFIFKQIDNTESKIKENNKEIAVFIADLSAKLAECEMIQSQEYIFIWNDDPEGLPAQGDTVVIEEIDGNIIYLGNINQ